VFEFFVPIVTGLVILAVTFDLVWNIV